MWLMKKKFDSDVIGKLFIMARHIKVMVVFLTQHLNALGPKMRNNADVIISFRDTNCNNRRTLQDQFMTLSSMNRKLVQQYMDKCLGEAYQCIVVCVYIMHQANTLSDYIYTYKAQKMDQNFVSDRKNFGTSS